jgi:hypothetical protein
MIFYGQEKIFMTRFIPYTLTRIKICQTCWLFCTNFIFVQFCTLIVATERVWQLSLIALLAIMFSLHGH